MQRFFMIACNDRNGRGMLDDQFEDAEQNLQAEFPMRSAETDGNRSVAEEASARSVNNSDI